MRSVPERRQSSTLAEVAREAGVSIATVSRVLNGTNKERWAGTAARAEKIRQTARRLGYSPDFRARALRARSTNSIGVVYSQVHPMMDLTSYALLFRAFGGVLDAAGYHMMFVHVPRTAGVLPASILQSVDAAVYYHSISDGAIEAAGVVRGPSILVNCEPKLPYPRVEPDDVGGATALARHLIELGHRRVLYIDKTRPGADFVHYSSVVRPNVVRRVFTDAGLGDGFELWRTDIDSPHEEVLARYLGLPADRRPTAIVVTYSVHAISYLNCFLHAGIKVPEELSIATFDDHELVSRAIVPITTVAVPMEEMGRTAAGLLLGLIQKPDQKPPKDIVLPERLIVRRSTGPAPR